MSDERPELKPDEARALTRRRLLKAGVRGACLLGLGGAVAALGRPARTEHMVWQLDPYKCIQCGKCATNCVLTPSERRGI